MGLCVLIIVSANNTKAGGCNPATLPLNPPMQKRCVCVIQIDNHRYLERMLFNSLKLICPPILMKQFCITGMYISVRNMIDFDKYINKYM